MMLDVYKCDREECGEESGPIGEEDLPPFVTIIEPCPEHGYHQYHYCSLECALHGLAKHLDHVEHAEALSEED